MNVNKFWIVSVFLLFLFPSFVFGFDTNYISSVDVERGNPEGYISSTKVFNSMYYRIKEVSNYNSLSFYFNVNDVKGNISNLVVNQRYNGGSSHEVYFDVYDYVSSSWINLKIYTNNNFFVTDTFDLSIFGDDIINDSTIKFRYLHPDNGVTTHYFDVDYFVIISSGVEYDDFGFFVFDFSNIFIIIMFGLFQITSILLIFLKPFKHSLLVGGILLMTLGLVLLFNDVIPLFGLILLLCGFISLFIEE